VLGELGFDDDQISALMAPPQTAAVRP
jgi:hypothetical protein